MKCPLTLATIFSMSMLTACTSLKPVEASPEEVQRLIVEESIIGRGDRVRLVTRDESVHEFRVTGVDREQGVVLGEDQRVPIDDIIAVDTRQTSVGRTSLLVGGVGYGLWAVAMIVIAPALILGGG